MQQQEQPKPQEPRSLKEAMLSPMVPGHPKLSLLASVVAAVLVLVLVFKVM